MVITTAFNRKRVALNLAALAELTQDQPDKKALEQYSGWGGLREAVYDRETYRQLKSVLSDSDIHALKQTCRSAYYTPDKIVDFIYDRLAKAGCMPTRILEPSAGHGVFLKRMPRTWSDKAWVTVEKDRTSARLLKALYPQADSYHQGFEDFDDSQGFDLIIGNPPYGQTKINDEKHPDLAEVSIHHYFVAKCMRLLKPNGFLAMVLPRYFLDAAIKHVRQLIADEGGSLIEAYRLPDDLFDDAKVTVDIVILKKCQGSKAWLKTETVHEGAKQAEMNAYFFQHPRHVLGEINFIHVYGRDELTCKRQAGQEEFILAEPANQVSCTSFLDSHALEGWQAKLAMQMRCIEERKQGLMADLSALDKQAAHCQQLIASLHTHYQAGQQLQQSLSSL